MEDFSLSEIFILFLDNQSREGKWEISMIFIDCEKSPVHPPMR